MAKKGNRLKDVKAEKMAKKRRMKRRKRALFLFIEVILLAILVSAAYMLTKYGKIQGDIFEKTDIKVNEGISQNGYTTIALFGGDSREGQLEAGTHADTIIVVSIDNESKVVRLASIYRDTLIQKTDGSIKKANSAYFEGGPKAAINMLNTNLDLDIQEYVTVDFKALADAIDLLGGITIDVSEAEAVAMNEYIWETAMVAGKEGMEVSAGEQNLDGVQAVTYARIRKNVGGDYARTDRQRLVIQKLVEKVKKSDLKTINEIINQVFPQISTSFTLSEGIKLAGGMLQFKLGESNGFPFERTDAYVDGVGSVVVPLGVVENVEELHALLYPNDDYVVSQTVKDIAKEIEFLSGYSREDYVE